MRMTHLASLTALFMVSLAGACSSSPNDPVGETADELRALESREKLGVIRYGDTKTVEYTDSPIYRAFTFEGAAGDHVDITVKATSGSQARVWLLSSSYRTLASAVGANAGQGTSRISRELTQPGSFFIVFRELNQEETTFTVSLSKAGATPAPTPTPGSTPAPATDDPFSDTTCSGPALSPQEIAALIPAGGTKHSLGTMPYRAESRVCNEWTGCSPWQASAESGQLDMSAEIFEVTNSSGRTRIPGFSAWSKSANPCAVEYGIRCYAGLATRPQGFDPSGTGCHGFNPTADAIRWVDSSGRDRLECHYDDTSSAIKATRGCLRVYSFNKSAGNGGSHTETRVGGVLRF